MDIVLKGVIIKAESYKTRNKPWVTFVAECPANTNKKAGKTIYKVFLRISHPSFYGIIMGYFPIVLHIKSI
jgi:hypothetical protein